MCDFLDEILNQVGSAFEGVGEAAGSAGESFGIDPASASSFGDTAVAGAESAGGSGAASALGGVSSIADVASGIDTGAGASAAEALGGSPIQAGGASSVNTGATGSPSAAAALGASPVAPPGVTAPLAAGGGAAGAGNVGDVGAGQVASQTGVPAVTGGPSPGATDVGSLTGKGTDNFGGEFVPDQQGEGGRAVGGGNQSTAAPATFPTLDQPGVKVPAAGAAAAPTDDGFFGKNGTLNSVLNNPAARLGIAALPAAASLIRGQPAVPQDIKPLTAGGAVTSPLIATETSQLNAANSGTLTAPQAAQVANFKQKAEGQLFQQLANQGVADPRQDSRFVQGLQEIEQQATAMTENFVQTAFKNGFTAAGAAAPALTTAANAQVAQDNDFQSALNAAMQAFGQAQGLAPQKAAA